MNDQLRQILADALGVALSAINEQTGSTTEPRWDSLRHMQIVFALEDVYGVRFRDDEIAGLPSVSAISAALAQRGVTM